MHDIYDKFQQRLLKLKEYYFKHYSIPSYSMLMDMFGLASKSGIHLFMKGLEKEGYVQKLGDDYIATDKLGALPLYSYVQAGMPTTATDEVQAEINIQGFLVRKPQSTFLVKVKGDSMKDAGIMDGDVVIVDQAMKNPMEGDIIVAVVDGVDTFTVKYFAKDAQGRKYLQPANDDFEPIYPRHNMEVVGKVVGTFRRYF
ncbi:LexA family transcriptional regulator [Patescibacteria group bacterium]|nr:LexA family transcriptional regulator [Patescibacteria group bacterium]